MVALPPQKTQFLNEKLENRKIWKKNNVENVGTRQDFSVEILISYFRAFFTLKTLNLKNARAQKKHNFLDKIQKIEKSEKKDVENIGTRQQFPLRNFEILLFEILQSYFRTFFDLKNIESEKCARQKRTQFLKEK